MYHVQRRRIWIHWRSNVHFRAERLCDATLCLHTPSLLQPSGMYAAGRIRNVNVSFFDNAIRITFGSLFQTERTFDTRAVSSDSDFRLVLGVFRLDRSGYGP